MTTIKANIVNKNNEELTLSSQCEFDFMYIVQAISNTNFDIRISESRLIGELRDLNNSEEYNKVDTILNNATHVINNIKIDFVEKLIEVDIRILDTPRGALLCDYYNFMRLSIQFLPRIMNKRIFTFDFYQKNVVEVLEIINQK